MNTISINILDDYFDDGCTPDGRIQETFAYVDSDTDDDSCKDILSILSKKVYDLGYCASGVELNLSYTNQADQFPNLVGTEYEKMLQKRWELNFKHLTHEMRENLVEQLSGWIEQGMHIEVYSES